MIEVKDLSKSYGSRDAISNVSFNIERGRVYGLLGPNGVGKSTTMNIMTGCLESSGGTVTVDGFDIYEKAADAKRKIGYLPEIPPLYTDMTPFEFLKFVAKAKKFKGDADAEARRVAALCGVTDVGDRLIKYLSKGYCQRVGIASALVGDPEYIILDEPTVGLDPKQILEIRTLIKKLGKNHTVILSSHILSEIQAVCDRIIIINHGVVAAHDTTDNLSRNVSNDHRIIARIEGPRDEIVKALRNISGIKYVKADMEREPGVYEYELEATPGSDIRREIFHIAAEHDWPLLSARSAEMTLEDVFLKITMGEGIVIPNAEDQAEAKKGEKA